jgi:hypothetical protein
MISVHDQHMLLQMALTPPMLELANDCHDILQRLQESCSEAAAFMQVSHFIMDEALSRKESVRVP